MPHAVLAAAIYARVCDDRDGAGLGATRQLEDCRKRAKDRGWQVAEEYVDNDISAYSGKIRPRYRDMLADIEARARDAVIAYHLDRLHRPSSPSRSPRKKPAASARACAGSWQPGPGQGPEPVQSVRRAVP